LWIGGQTAALTAISATDQRSASVLIPASVEVMAFSKARIRSKTISC
jgi:hypothetical protein